MKIYIAYKFAGENQEELINTLTKMESVLGSFGHSVYFASKEEDLFRDKKFTAKQILNHALKELDNSDCILVFVRSNEKSEGMLIEIGYALAKKKKIILAIKKGINLYFTEDISDKVVEFEDTDDLLIKLSKLKI